MRQLPHGYKIRSARKKEVRDLIALDRAASELFRPTGLIRDMGEEPESIPAETLSEAIAARAVLVVAFQGKAVGFALFRWIEGAFYLDQISVHPDHGHKGLGRALMRAVFDEARHYRASAVYLSTFRDLAWNGPFYRTLGFEEIARTDMLDWMYEIENVQSTSMDTTLRCFMRFPI